MRMLKVCPVCGSEHIDYAALETRSGASIIGIGTPEKYYCKDCGYAGSVILEMDKKTKAFYEKTHAFEKPPRKLYPKHHQAEIMKPVFMTVLLLIIATSLMFLFPRYEITKELPQGEGITQWSEMQLPMQETEAVQIGQQWISVKESPMKQIDTAYGLGNVGDFLVPIAILFFTMGFFAIMIYNHWHRAVFFSE